MLDSTIRPFIQKPLMLGARVLFSLKMTPNMVTALGLIFAFLAFAALFYKYYGIALCFLCLNRLADGLDGPLAQCFQEKGKAHNCDFGSYFDIVSDFIFYGGFPLFFALGAPEHLLAACILLFGFVLSGTSFLAYAIIAEKRKLKTEAQGKKGFYYMAGLMEGSETILFFIGMLVLPPYFDIIAYIFSGLCALTLCGRLMLARQNF